MNDLSFAEVDEAVRQEKIATIWSDYGAYIITFIVGTILITATMSGYKTWDLHTRTEQTNKVLELIESADFPDNIDRKTIKLRNDIKSMLFMRVAARHLENGDTETAQSYYQDIAENGAKHYKELALIMLSRLSPETSPAETLKSIKPKNIWYPHAALEIAVYEGENNNNYGQAIDLLKTIIDGEDVPETLKQKAAALQHLFEIKNAKAAQKGVLEE